MTDFQTPAYNGCDAQVIKLIEIGASIAPFFFFFKIR